MIRTSNSLVQLEWINFLNNQVATNLPREGLMMLLGTFQ